MQAFDNERFKRFMENNKGRVIYSAQHYRTAVLQTVWEDKKKILDIMKMPYFIQVDEIPDRHEAARL